MEENVVRYYEVPRDSINYFREEYEFLSNFYPTKITFGGVIYYNAESAYQAQKCLSPEDRIKFSLLSSDEAKRLGKKSPTRSDWDDIKLNVMEQVVCAKFTQNPILAQDLLDTGDKPLVEGNNWKDLFWGVDLKSGEGKNNLGKILMSLRSTFLSNGISSLSLPNNSLTGPLSGIWIDDRNITLSDCECIVNPISKEYLGGGVDGEIYRAAGPQLREHCSAIGEFSVGDAKMTSGYRLKSKYIIHVLGPKYPSENCSDNLAKCYTSCLDLAKKHGIKSIVFPVISTGRFSYPQKEACKIAVKTVHDWLNKNRVHNIKVVFSSVNPKIHELIYAELSSIIE